MEDNASARPLPSLSAERITLRHARADLGDTRATGRAGRARWLARPRVECGA